MIFCSPLGDLESSRLPSIVNVKLMSDFDCIPRETSFSIRRRCPISFTNLRPSLY